MCCVHRWRLATTEDALAKDTVVDLEAEQAVYWLGRVDHLWLLKIAYCFTEDISLELRAARFARNLAAFALPALGSAADSACESSPLLASVGRLLVTVESQHGELGGETGDTSCSACGCRVRHCSCILVAGGVAQHESIRRRSECKRAAVQIVHVDGLSAGRGSVRRVLHFLLHIR